MPTKPINQGRVVVVICILSFLCLLGGINLLSGLRKSANPCTRTPKLSMGWKVPGGRVCHISFSPEGTYVCMIRKGGYVTVYSASGRIIYATHIPDVNKAVISSKGRYTAVYSHINKTNDQVKFLDSKGELIWKRGVRGAIWSADVYSSDRGECFLFGTGEGYVYTFEVGDRTRRYRRWRAPGAVVSIAMDTQRERITVGTWQDSSVLCMNTRYRKDWEIATDSASLQNVQSLSSGKMLVSSIPNRIGADGSFSIIDSDGKAIWQGKLDMLRQARIIPSPCGRFVILGYHKLIKEKHGTLIEKHVALLGEGNTELWDKGSMFLQIDPVAVTSEGCAIVSNKSKLFTLSSSGKLEPSVELPSRIESSLASPDGSKLILRCADDFLYFVKMNR